MPELPEVETTRLGLLPHIRGERVRQVVIREPRLRWPIPAQLIQELPGQRLQSLIRRGKYLLFGFANGHLILHLGMSGSLRILAAETPAQRHDHFDLLFEEGPVLRLRDPRRFGAVLWTQDPPAQHRLLRRLGPEPLGREFSGDPLYLAGRRRRISVKGLIMDSQVVVGVGNIYANEALFLAGIHPLRRCDRIARDRYQLLAEAIVGVLSRAIEQGGTTLRDFQREDGRPGYFAQELRVYGRAGLPCPGCGSPIKQRRIGQRSSFYCTRCQH